MPSFYRQRLELFNYNFVKSLCTWVEISAPKITKFVIAPVIIWKSSLHKSCSTCSHEEHVKNSARSNCWILSSDHFSETTQIISKMTATNLLPNFDPLPVLIWKSSFLGKSQRIMSCMTYQNFSYIQRLDLEKSPNNRVQV